MTTPVELVLKVKKPCEEEEFKDTNQKPYIEEEQTTQQSKGQTTIDKTYI